MRIAFASNRDGDYEVYTADAAGSDVTQVTATDESDYDPRWSPDGARLLFVSFRDGEAELYLVDAEGGEPINLSRNATMDERAGATWSPDGAQILYSAHGNPPVEAVAYIRADLGVATVLVWSAVLAIVGLLIVSVGRPPGAFTLVLTINAVLVAAPHGNLRFLPAAIVAGLIVDLGLFVAGRRLSPRATTMLAAGSSRPHSLLATSSRWRCSACSIGHRICGSGASRWQPSSGCSSVGSRRGGSTLAAPSRTTCAPGRGTPERSSRMALARNQNHRDLIRTGIGLIDLYGCTCIPRRRKESTMVKFLPLGYGTVTPFVIVKGASGFIDFMVRAFDGVELGRVGEEGAIGHAEVRIGDSVVMLFDSKPDWPPTPAFLRLYVPDSDATFRQAIDAGAQEVSRPTDMLWGDRAARVRDPFGNLWWITTHVEDVPPVEEARRWGDPAWLKGLRYMESAEFFPGS